MKDSTADGDTIGARIKAARARLGITQEDLGERIGATKNRISAWETSLNMPEVDSLLRLADALGCSADYLLGRADAIDGRTTLPRGWLMVDMDKVERIRSAESVEDLESVIEWEPHMVLFSEVVPQNLALINPKDYAQLHAEMVGHLQRLDEGGALTNSWIKRIGKQKGGISGWLAGWMLRL